MKKIFFLAALFCGAVFTAEAQIKSVYTELDAEKCKTLELDEEGSGLYLGECPGTAGYKLHVREGDLRQSVDIITPKKETQQLGFWNVSSAFSAVGPRAEWRLRGNTPIALIVRFNVSEDVEDSSKITSYLIVSKITAAESCITEVVKPSRNQNVEARRSADNSASKPCLYPNEDF